MKQKMKNVLAGCLLAAMVFAAIPPIAASATTYGGPAQDFAIPVVTQTTVPAGYTGIYTTADLDNIRNNLDGKYILMNDIVFSDADFQSGGAFYNDGRGWIGIGSYYHWEQFTGILDGNGFMISGLISKSLPSKTETTCFQGLFELSSGTIKNLAMSEVSIESDQYAWSASIATLNLGLINNCMTFGKIDQSSYIPKELDNYEAAGGICAQNGEGGTISFSKNYCTVTTCNHSGGIVASNQGTIESCANFGQIFTIKHDSNFGATGGIASHNQAIISKCYNAGVITGVCYAGGIAGSSFSETTAVITDCFNTGLVKTILTSSNSWKESAAGIVCSNSVRSSVINSYSTGLLICTGSDPTLGGVCGDLGYLNRDLDASGKATNSYYLDTTGNNDFGTALTYAEMASKSSYVGFDFTNVWVMSPTLKRPVLRGFLPDTYDITYELNGGSLSSSAPTAYMDGSNRLLPTPAKEGFSFQGWYTDASLDGKAVRMVPDGSTGAAQYFAKWGPAADDDQNPQKNVDGNPDTGDRENNWLLFGILIGSLLLLATTRWWYNKATE